MKGAMAGLPPGSASRMQCTPILTAEGVFERRSMLRHEITDFIDVCLAERKIPQNPYICRIDQNTPKQMEITHIYCIKND